MFKSAQCFSLSLVVWKEKKKKAKTKTPKQHQSKYNNKQTDKNTSPNNLICITWGGESRDFCFSNVVTIQFE